MVISKDVRKEMVFVVKIKITNNNEFIDNLLIYYFYYFRVFICLSKKKRPQTSALPFRIYVALEKKQHTFF